MRHSHSNEPRRRRLPKAGSQGFSWVSCSLALARASPKATRGAGDRAVDVDRDLAVADEHVDVRPMPAFVAGVDPDVKFPVTALRRGSV